MRPAEAPARWRENDLAAFDELPALSGPELPWSEWSMRPSAIAAAIGATSRRTGPGVVELGAGASTIVLARWARARHGTLVSIEHDPEWAPAVRALLRREGLDATAEVVDARIEPLPETERPEAPGFEPPYEWYEIDAVRAACPDRVDLMVVDGPPAGHAPRQLVRAPTLGVLRDLLGPDCAIVLDDVQRPAERATAKLWRGELGGATEMHEESDAAVLVRDRIVAR